jgi:hypothetical protein
MSIERNRLYSLILIACFAGYIWLCFNLANDIENNKSIEVCFVKRLTSIPCPSCGSTRSVISIIKGHFIEAFYLNPIGYIVAIIMLMSPVWIITDWVLRRYSFFYFYQKVETYLKKPSYAIPLILILIVNWIWNITKGL